MPLRIQVPGTALEVQRQPWHQLPFAVNVSGGRAAFSYAAELDGTDVHAQLATAVTAAKQRWLPFDNFALAVVVTGLTIEQALACAKEHTEAPAEDSAASAEAASDDAAVALVQRVLAVLASPAGVAGAHVTAVALVPAEAATALAARFPCFTAAYAAAAARVPGRLPLPPQPWLVCDDGTAPLFLGDATVAADVRTLSGLRIGAIVSLVNASEWRGIFGDDSSGSSSSSSVQSYLKRCGVSCLHLCVEDRKEQDMREAWARGCAFIAAHMKAQAGRGGRGRGRGRERSDHSPSTAAAASTAEEEEEEEEEEEDEEEAAAVSQLPGILVHCKQGLSRSYSLVLAWLMTQAAARAGSATVTSGGGGYCGSGGASGASGVSLAAAQAAVAGYTRHGSLPRANAGFMRQLQELEAELRATASSGQG